MPPPTRSNYGKDESYDDGYASVNLWIGNLPPNASETDLTTVFSQFGPLDSVSTYSNRNYAFVYFKHLEHAKAAREKLQGTVLLGNRIKIEFARPAKPARHLWVGGVSSSVTKEQLEYEFLKFGKMEEFKFLKDRTALVDYYKLEDAIAALKHLNGKRLGGEKLRVDYFRSQHARKENWPEDSRDGHIMKLPESQWLPPDALRNFPEPSLFGSRNFLPSQLLGGRSDNQASNVLWVGYPPSIQIDEQMLHNSMILFGEIERIKNFPSRNFSLVEFRSVDEARRAKEGLQGRLFGDTRIQILFVSGEIGLGQESPPIFGGIRGSRPGVFINDVPYGFGPGPIDPYNPNLQINAINFAGPRPLNGIPGTNMLMRPFRPQGLDPLSGAPDFNDMSGGRPNFPESVPNLITSNWRGGPGLLPSPAQGVRPQIRATPGMSDVFDKGPFQRESKRSRVDESVPIEDFPMNPRHLDNQQVRRSPGFHVQGQNHPSPRGRYPNESVSNRDERQDLPEIDHCWRGIIAKGGTPVCHARCIPVGKRIDFELPKVVNCSARTGLDMLTKHYADATGFDIVFFLPDSEEDFSSYTEFLRYLGERQRAGVAKLDDGTTLFLVPPSDFLSKVLLVSGPERLYGVVLKLPQQSPRITVQQPQVTSIPPSSHYLDRPHSTPSQRDYNLAPTTEDQILQSDYSRISREDLIPQSSSNGNAKMLSSQMIEAHSVPSSSDYTSINAPPPPPPPPPPLPPSTAPSTLGSLTPELIATLAALLPSNMHPTIQNTTPSNLGNSQRTSLSSTFVNQVTPTPSWRQDQPITGQDQSSLSAQVLNQQLGNQAQILSQLQSFSNIPNVTEQSSQVSFGTTQAHDSSLNAQHALLSGQPGSFTVPSQGGHFSLSNVNPSYNLDTFQNSQNYVVSSGSDVSGLYHTPTQHQPNNIPTPVQGVQSGSLSLPQSGMHLVTSNTNTENLPLTQPGSNLAANKANMELHNPVQQVQSSFPAPVQSTAEGEADKNQRYQSTLQFAANLLLQIQQQQANTHGAQVSNTQK